MTGASPVILGLVGVGKIARDQHLPAIAADGRFRLQAVASRHATVDGVPSYHDIGQMLDAEGDITAVSLCTPPQGRHDLARQALERGCHVMLEKPPGATLAEIDDLRHAAERAGRTLFATWHSRFAPAVEPARAWLADKTLRSVKVDWREDVRHWHPGQEWIWEPGGLGVFDPGINALSILTRLLPRPVFVDQAVLRFPSNRQTPVAADLKLRDEGGLPITVGFDWLQTGPQTWNIEVETDPGTLLLTHGGARLYRDGQEVLNEKEAEYPRLYDRFARLIAEGRSDVDISPLRLVSDAFLSGRRELVEEFYF
ncbi:MAG: Gfo/Idh/MocA family oxidoreductase [Azospirillaceae bacterium]|nr:Gfo/Idh/MocA family oxidoreductase [Azospirillaceae bacterium]